MAISSYTERLRVVGVDPGLQTTGYGIIDRLGGELRLVEGGLVRSHSTELLEARLQRIYAQISDVLREFEPDVAVVEEVYAKYTHPRTAILMGHARGVVYLAAAERGVGLQAYAASTVKRALVGSGRASKEQIRRMVARQLGLGEEPLSSHVADALALAICHVSPARLRDAAAPRRGERLPPRLRELAQEERP